MRSKLPVKPKKVRMTPLNPPDVIYSVRFNDGVMLYVENERVAEMMATVDERITQIFTYRLAAELKLPKRRKSG